LNKEKVINVEKERKNNNLMENNLMSWQWSVLGWCIT